MVEHKETNTHIITAHSVCNVIFKQINLSIAMETQFYTDLVTMIT